MEDEDSRILAVSRQLTEKFKAAMAESKKIIERSYQLIDESHKAFDKWKSIVEKGTARPETRVAEQDNEMSDGTFHRIKTTASM